MNTPVPPAPLESPPETGGLDAQGRLFELFAQLGISYQHFTHPAVFSTADVVLLPEKLPGVDTKNLFLRDEKRQRFVLVCLRAETRVNLKELGRLLQLKGITFASAEELRELLGVTPGSVCLFALLNDSAGRVTGYLDGSIEPAAPMQNHPLVNVATVVMQSAEVERFCAHLGHPLTRIEVPTR